MVVTVELMLGGYLHANAPGERQHLRTASRSPTCLSDMLRMAQSQPNV
jgi:hypothetical protein